MLHHYEDIVLIDESIIAVEILLCIRYVAFGTIIDVGHTDGEIFGWPPALK